MAIFDWFIILAICLVAALCGTLLMNGARPKLRNRIAEQSAGNEGFGQQQGVISVGDRAAWSDAPIPVWTTGLDGRPTWGNEAYMKLVGSEHDPDFRPAQIFPELPRTDDPNPTRVVLNRTNHPENDWYDIVRRRREDHEVFFALNVSSLVAAENSRTSFFQTMAATFAHLSIGLAIFDRDMRLHLFNPALVDMFGLPIQFLSMRPEIATFFDRMRDTRAMPEPKDYSTWRQEISDLAKAASEGRYQETWSLPSGAVYQVTGQPHPGGATAFLFEDISAEVNLARQFRGELELCQSVLSLVDEAICVFSTAEKMVYFNRSYQKLWEIPKDLRLRGTTLADAKTLWSTRADVSPEFFAKDNFQDNTWGQSRFPVPGYGSTSCICNRLQTGELVFRFRKAPDEEPASHSLVVEPA